MCSMSCLHVLALPDWQSKGMQALAQARSMQLDVCHRCFANMLGIDHENPAGNYQHLTLKSL